MMKVIVRDPKSEVQLELQVRPAMRAGISGWEVDIANDDWVWITDNDGYWTAETKKANLNEEFIQAIGEAIKPPHQPD